MAFSQLHSKARRKILDFSPLIFKSVNSGDVYLIPNSARETWLTAETLKLINQTFDIKNHPEMFLGLNGKIIANAYSIFDNPYGINYYEKNLTASDKRILDLILLQWNLYSQFAPQLGGEDKLYNRDFPWYNSTELTKLYPDKNELRIALFKLFYLPAATFSIKDDKIIAGIEGAKIDLLQAYNEYKKIIDLYEKNSTLSNPFFGEVDPRFYYYDWLGDRGAHGLSNTLEQFVGIKDPYFLGRLIRKYPRDFWDYIKDYNGLDQFLTKHWKYWDLVKFIVGYERWNPKVGEVEGIDIIMPAVLRMAGYPVSHINIDPTPAGSANREWAVGLPPYIVKAIGKNFSNMRILFGPGCTFGLYSCADGLMKERGPAYPKPITNGIEEAYIMIGDKLIYLMKRN